MFFLFQPTVMICDINDLNEHWKIYIFHRDALRVSEDWIAVYSACNQLRVPVGTSEPCLRWQHLCQTASKEAACQGVNVHGGVASGQYHICNGEAPIEEEYPLQMVIFRLPGLLWLVYRFTRDAFILYRLPTQVNTPAPMVYAC